MSDLGWAKVSGITSQYPLPGRPLSCVNAPINQKEEAGDESKLSPAMCFCVNLRYRAVVELCECV